MRSPVTGLIEQYNALTDVEQKVFLDLVDPQPEPQRVAKRGASKKASSRKGQCAACDYNKVVSIHHDSALVGYHVYQPTAKSRRATSLAEQIKPTGKPHLGEGPVCTICSHTEDYEDHFKPSPHCHKFEPPKPVASVTRRSSRKGAGTNSESVSTVGASGD